MQKIVDSYSYIRRNIAKVAHKLILDWFEVTRFTPSNFQFPL
jgi:hypothetical protein